MLDAGGLNIAPAEEAAAIHTPSGRYRRRRTIRLDSRDEHGQPT